MRLFIAISLSSEIIEHIRDIQKKLPQNATFSIEKQPHITIKFLGETTPTDATKTQEELSNVRFQSFQAKLNGIGLFTDKVIWAGIEPHNHFEELRKNVDTSLKTIFPKDEKFHPHITLARIKKILDEEEFKKSINNIKVKDLNFIVDKFVLIQSIIDSNGTTYKELAVYHSYE